MTFYPNDRRFLGQAELFNYLETVKFRITVNFFNWQKLKGDTGEGVQGRIVEDRIGNLIGYNVDRMGFEMI